MIERWLSPDQVKDQTMTETLTGRGEGRLRRDRVEIKATIQPWLAHDLALVSSVAGEPRFSELVNDP